MIVYNVQVPLPNLSLVSFLFDYLIGFSIFEFPSSPLLLSPVSCLDRGLGGSPREVSGDCAACDYTKKGKYCGPHAESISNGLVGAEDLGI